MGEPTTAEFVCEMCGEDFTVTPAPDEPWPHCLGEHCLSYDPERDVDLMIEHGEFPRSKETEH